MKQQRDHGRRYAQNPLEAAAVLTDFRSLTNLVEKLSVVAPGHRPRPQLLGDNHASLHTSSLEAYVSGDVRFEGQKGQTPTRFFTSFFFSCVENLEGENELAWWNSLS